MSTDVTSTWTKVLPFAVAGGAVLVVVSIAGGIGKAIAFGACGFYLAGIPYVAKKVDAIAADVSSKVDTGDIKTEIEAAAATGYHLLIGAGR